MKETILNSPRSHGTGEFQLSDFSYLGQGVVFESHVLVFHPENIEINENVYVGHYTILKGYYKNKMIIGTGSWIGQQCFFHSAGGLSIGKNTGIGPGVKIITSFHSDGEIEKPLLHSKVKFASVAIESDCDIGAGAIILPGVTIGQGAMVGAGAVVNKNIPAYAVAVGVPARVIRMRNGSKNDGV
ncbi:MAG: acyltransferase [Desulfobacula sp.]|jgi:acetyltransferase-like isoleucine patch superfamily enzyme